MITWKSYSKIREKDALTHFIDSLVERIEIGKGSLLIIDGGLGEGKTTLAIEIADYINEKYAGKDIEIESCQYSIGAEKFVNHLTLCYHKGFHVCVYDEAGDFNKRSSLANMNKHLNNVFNMYRSLKVLVIICLPSASFLDSDLFLKGIVRGALHLHKRDKVKGYYAGYDLDRINWVKKKMDFSPTKSLAYSKVKPNFEGEFYNLPEPRATLLDKVSTKGKLDFLFKTARDMENLITRQELQKMFGISKEQLVYCFKKNFIKAETIIKHKAYYNKSIIPILKNSLKTYGDLKTP